MWEKCVSCGEGLFAGDAFCGNCGRPATSAVPAAREPEGAEPARPDAAAERIRPAMPAEPDGPPQLELGLGLAPVLGTPAGPAGPTAATAATAAAGANSTSNGQLSVAAEAAGQPTPGGHLDPAMDSADLPAPGELLDPATGAADLPAPGELLDPATDAAGRAGPDSRVDPATDPAGHAGPDRRLDPAMDAADQDGADGQFDPVEDAAGPPEPEVLIIPARQVGGPAGPGRRLTVPAQRRGQPSQPGQPAGPADRALRRTRLTGQANLDPAQNARFLLRVLRQAAIFAGIYALAETILLIVFLILGCTGWGLAAAFRLETQSLWQVALALAILFWIIPVPALLGQWTMLVESSADASGVAFEHIATAFRDHDAPLDSLEVRAVSPPRESARDYLELRRGRFSGFISCFPHGGDLYVGWTFFLRMSPARLMLMNIGRTVQHVTRRGGDVQRALWFESTRALVAAMHSATLAGVGSAVSAPDAPGASTDSADDVVVKFG